MDEGLAVLGGWVLLGGFVLVLVWFWHRGAERRAHRHDVDGEAGA